ncbi:MAG TPA: TonB-dependent receptor plug domain-containing protein [Gemmatimonadaceae bacterium]|nr:TonB-dependent receptor plug domain-containing protein [Gemmatimonadaceae bacterium]
MRATIPPIPCATALRCAASSLLTACAISANAIPRPEQAPDSVSVGYGTLARTKVTGPVVSVTRTRDERRRVARVDELLLGLPGVEVTRLSATSFTVRVRGAALADREPLYVIDGVPQPLGVPGSVALAGVNPADVRRIDVLKGSSAAAYGSRGANGVILIARRK